MSISLMDVRRRLIEFAYSLVSLLAALFFCVVLLATSNKLLYSSQFFLPLLFFFFFFFFFFFLGSYLPARTCKQWARERMKEEEARRTDQWPGSMAITTTKRIRLQRSISRTKLTCKLT